MKQRLASKFKSRELGKVKSFLNWELEKTSEKLIISQKKCSKEVLEQFDIKPKDKRRHYYQRLSLKLQKEHKSLIIEVQ